MLIRLGAVSHPGRRHVHQRSIPRLGGIAICAGFLVSLGGLYLFDPEAAALFGAIPRRVLGLVAGGVILCAVGVVDDTRGVQAAHGSSCGSRWRSAPTRAGPRSSACTCRCSTSTPR